MVPKSFLLGGMFIFLTVSVHAEDTTAIIKKYHERIREILNKTGIDFSGKFKSEYFGADLSGGGVDAQGRNVETNEYSSVDFDIHARPYSFVSGRVIFRMHHNWQNLWSGSNNPIFSRWISMDGAISDKLYFHVGDFKSLYTPLTLYAPEPEILFEPELFGNLRKDAMDEVFLGNHERPLQGLTIGYAARGASLFEEIHANILGARLRNIETSIQNGSLVATPFEAAPDFSKLLFGSNLETRLIKWINIGGSYLFIFDDKRSFNESSVIADTAAQKTSIADVRAECDLARWCNMRDGHLRIYGEAAFSFDDSASYEGGNVGDLRHKNIPGSASFGGVSLKTSRIKSVLVDLDMKYIRNESNFRNELAQSPSFLGKRIMNIEGDGKSGNTMTPNHYSTFDALYHTVFKFCPRETTNQWVKAPFSKNAYSSNVYTHDQLNIIAAHNLDPSLQLIMPFGPATPNRQGMSADVSVQSIDTNITVRGVFNALGERKSEMDTTAKAATTFLQAGIGMSLDISKWLKMFAYPCRISLSSVSTGAHNTESGFAITTSFTNAGVHLQVLKKLALLGGLQIIDNTFNQSGVSQNQRQTHWSVGLSWHITRGADVMGSIGQIIVDNSDLSKTAGPQRNSGGKFQQLLSDVSLQAYF
jgi:hypothetical protein